MKLIRIIFISIAATIAALAQSGLSLMSYQGRLTDEAGAPLTNGVYRLAFRLYTNAIQVNGESLIWGRQYDASVVAGDFNVILGAPGGIPLAEPTAVNDLVFAFTESGRFLELRIVRTPEGTEVNRTILPRQQLLGVPYAVSAANGVPAGTVLPFAGSSPPVGFLLCDGRSLSRQAYPMLFQAIGRAWGKGDGGEDDFSIPDLRGRIAVGVGKGGVLDLHGRELTNRELGVYGGEEVHRLTVAEMPAHKHNITGLNDVQNDGNPTLTGPGRGWTKATELEGGDQPHNNMPPFAALNYIIKI